MVRLIDEVTNDADLPWKDNTRDQFAIDSNAVLEALLAEYGVEAAVIAVHRQGFRGKYRHIIERLHPIAVARRTTRNLELGNQES